jgi:tRNA pseudouridine13 synthase
MKAEPFQLPFITCELEGTGGTIKETNEDFQVEEIPLYELTGEGEHLFINITKNAITTKDVQKELAKIYQVKNQDVDFAGIKDKYALTTQTFSVWIKDHSIKDRAYQLEEFLPVKINWTKFHQRKIKKGHLAGNKFTIKITGIPGLIDDAIQKAEAIINKLSETGIPNFFGEQRFGIKGDNAQKGLDIMLGKQRIKNKWLKKFLLSSYQSYVFNFYLKKRIEEGLFGRILNGDVAKKQDTGGIFIVDDSETDQKRLENKEITFTGPIFGKKMRSPENEALNFENEILKGLEITREDFAKAKLTGTRRPGIIIPDINYRKCEDGIELKFTLPKGSFATVVLREIMKNFQG